MIEHHLTDICNAFGIKSEGISFGEGHINDTYLAQKDGNPIVLQRINTQVFKNPKEVMDNIFKVTAHLKSKIEKEGGNPNRETLYFLKTQDGQTFYTDPDGDCYRIYRFVENSYTIETVTDLNQFYEAAKTFGRFQNMLADFPAEELFETIHQFHDTPSRVAQLKAAVESDACGRLKMCEAEVLYAFDEAKDAGAICSALENGSLPARVTHNDTKLNNVLFDKATGRGICVIDLDTVMPGSLLYDFGDALRFGANTAAEDETDLDRVVFDLERFTAFTQGFASELKQTITPLEKELLPFSAKLMTYECGIRFLADFLKGDTYFKTQYATHNLDRAKNQFKLCREIDSKFQKMNKIVKESF